MAEVLTTAPVLSTPDNHILTETEPIQTSAQSATLSDQQLAIRYEINRTIKEIRQHKWRRVALQFPDHMLPHSPRVCEALSKGLLQVSEDKPGLPEDSEASLEVPTNAVSLDDDDAPVKLTILADTSYGSCCVDEIAAEHVDADAVVHYGRACLSPTARLPVLHVFTEMYLDQKVVTEAFIEAFPDRDAKVILTGDIPYASHIDPIGRTLQEAGYTQVFVASIIHDPSSPIPNRTIPSTAEEPSELADWHLFHIAEPPTSLLLTLSSRVKSVRIYDPAASSTSHDGRISAYEASTARILGRRYALVTSMATVSTWGILINTLSVKNYMSVMQRVKEQIAAAGKKSYLFVVGKLNAAKVANFADIEGWVVIGCWESSLIDSRDFYKPILTPFELELALTRDDRRVWTGAWRSDFGDLTNNDLSKFATETSEEQSDEEVDENQDLDSDEESAPPEFDLRTGRFVTPSRPVGRQSNSSRKNLHGDGRDSQALTKRVNGDMIAVNGVASPAAAYLNDKRTWKGLGSDFEVKYEDEEQEVGLIEEGRTGIARGYTVGDSSRT